MWVTSAMAASGNAKRVFIRVMYYLNPWHAVTRIHVSFFLHVTIQMMGGGDRTGRRENGDYGWANESCLIAFWCDSNDYGIIVNSSRLCSWTPNTAGLKCEWLLLQFRPNITWNGVIEDNYSSAISFSSRLNAFYPSWLWIEKEWLSSKYPVGWIT